MAVPTVFISHTSDLQRYPLTGQTFIDCAVAAVRQAGLAARQMRDFIPSPDPSVREVERIVRESEIYVGVIGFRYGSVVRSDPRVSYTEHEYVTAVAEGKPTFLFLLHPQAEVSPEMLVDSEYGARQERFRQVLQERHMVKLFHTPVELQNAILATLLAFLSSAPDTQDEMSLRQQVVLDPWNPSKRKDYLKRRTRTGLDLDRSQTPPLNLCESGSSTPTARVGIVGGMLAGAVSLPPVSVAAVVGGSHIDPGSAYSAAAVAWAGIVAVGTSVFVTTRDEGEAEENCEHVVGSAKEVFGWAWHQMRWYYAEADRLRGYFFRFNDKLTASFMCLWWTTVVVFLSAVAAVVFLGGLAGAMAGAVIGAGVGMFRGVQARTSVTRRWRRIGESLGPLPPNCPLDEATARSKLLP